MDNFFEDEDEKSYTPKDNSVTGKIRIAAPDGIYYVRPENEAKFRKRLNDRIAASALESAARAGRWEELEEPKPEKKKKGKETPDYSSVTITDYSTRELRVRVLEMTRFEMLAYLQHYRKKGNRASIKAIKLRLESMQEATG